MMKYWFWQPFPGKIHLLYVHLPPGLPVPRTLLDVSPKNPAA